MSLLNSVLGGLTGGAGGSSSPTQSGCSAGSRAARPGGLGSLISQFQKAGLGHVAKSWVGNGPNQPITPNQLHNVLGEQRVQGMADRPAWPGDFLSQLSQHLPNAVNGVTPDGRLPDEGSVSV